MPASTFRGLPKAAVLLVVMWGNPATELYGQASQIPTDARVRITTPCNVGPATSRAAAPQPCRTIGNLVSLEHDSLTFRSPESTHTYAVADVIRAEVSEGSRSYRRIGAAVGGVIGAAATYLVFNAGGSTSLCDRSANQDAAARGLCYGLFVLGGAAGAGLGSIAGGAITVERWHDVPLESLRVGVQFRLGY